MKDTIISKALKEDDVERLYELVDQFKEEGEDDIAAELAAIAHRIENDEWAYDRMKDLESECDWNEINIPEEEVYL